MNSSHFYTKIISLLLIFTFIVTNSVYPFQLRSNNTLRPPLQLKTEEGKARHRKAQDDLSYKRNITRRDFLKQSAIAGTAIAVRGPSYLEPQEESRVIEIPSEKFKARIDREYEAYAAHEAKVDIDVSEKDILFIIIEGVKGRQIGVSIEDQDYQSRYSEIRALDEEEILTEIKIPISEFDSDINKITKIRIDVGEFFGYRKLEGSSSSMVTNIMNNKVCKVLIGDEKAIDNIVKEEKSRFAVQIQKDETEIALGDFTWEIEDSIEPTWAAYQNLNLNLKVNVQDILNILMDGVRDREIGIEVRDENGSWHQAKPKKLMEKKIGEYEFQELNLPISEFNLPSDIVTGIRIHVGKVFGKIELKGADREDMERNLRINQLIKAQIKKSKDEAGTLLAAAVLAGVISAGSEENEKRVVDILKKERANFRLEGIRDPHLRDLLQALFKLGWLDLKPILGSRIGKGVPIYDFKLNKQKIDIVGVKGDYVATDVEGFINKDMKELSLNKIVVIRARDNRQKEILETHELIKPKIGKKLFIITLLEGSPAANQWDSLLGNERSYDFSEMKVSDMIKKKELIIALADQV